MPTSKQPSNSRRVGAQDLPEVLPLLVYRDIERAHEFLVRAFGLAPGLLERGETAVKPAAGRA